MLYMLYIFILELKAEPQSFNSDTLRFLDYWALICRFDCIATERGGLNVRTIAN
jgi:hypothetical protein